MKIKIEIARRMVRGFLPFYLFTFLLLITACSSSDDISDTSVNPGNTDPDPAAISFSTALSAGSTRATIGSIDNLDALKASGDGFGVFAYLTDANTWVTDSTAYKNSSITTEKLNQWFYMYNQQVKWGVQYVENDADEDPTNDVPRYDWVYSPLKYWPNTTNNATARNISFFAYAPYVAAAGATEGVTNFTNSTDKLPHVIYEIAGGNEQVDLLYANCIDAKRNGQGLITANTDPLVYQKIPLTFHHALAALDIYVQRVYDEPVYTGNKPAADTDTAKIYISKLELESAVNGTTGLQTGGRLDLRSGEWTSVGGAWAAATGKKLTYTEAMFDDYLKGTTSTDALVIRDTELGKFDEESGIDQYERTLMKNGMPQVFLPRQVTLIPKITFSMINKDNNLEIGYYTDQRGQKYSRVVNEVTGNTMTIDFQAGKRYKMLIRIGVEHISFEILSIVDWDFPLRYNPDVVNPFTEENIGHRVDEE